jgi:hypothetical protein
MPDQKKWRAKADANKGSQVIWINQSDNKDLKDIGSDGVCFAITSDWVKQYRSNRIARSKFVNAFRDEVVIDPKTGEPDPDTCIPLDYMLNQDEYSSMLKQHRKALKELELKLLQAPLDQPKIREDLDNTLRAMEVETYGSGLKQVTKFRAKKSQTITDAVAAMQANTNPTYYMLLLRRPGGGHVVGFEFRPDVVVSDNFPGLFEFIDANLGLYAFPSSANMINFFNSCAWAELYSAKGYDGFDLVEFDLGAGGF